MSEQDIFVAAMDLEEPAARKQYLDQACAGDHALRERVEKLIRQSEQLGSFLEHPPVEAVAVQADASRESGGAIDATIVHSNGTSYDDEDGVSHTERSDVGQKPHEHDDEIPLGYLQPSSQPNCLGRLGHYEILEVVGRGAFGTVLRAFDDKLRRVVAIKVLAPEMAATSPARKRFLREARTSAAIRHENVVAIHAVEDEPIPYLVMEYIPGQTLQQRLDDNGPLDVSDVLKIGKQIADGLAAAHANDLIHRDIKPGNILLEGGVSERVKITDFGLARTADDASMTQSGMIAGTPLYMAPEQALGHKLDQRADLFSLGSVLYQMLSGRPPFRATTTIAVLKRVVEDTPRPIQEIIPEVPAWMGELIGHLHAKNPDERYRSAREVSELLTQCASDLQAGRIPKTPSPAKPKEDSADESPAAAVQPAQLNRSEPRSRSPLVRIAAAVLILLGVLSITEATGVTRVAATVVRLATGSGTLVIEADDPGVKIAINGEAVTITGGGVEELTLRPGEYKIAALKDGQPVKQELVSITRNGRTVVRMSLEPSETIVSSAGDTNTGSSTVNHGLASGQPIDLISLLEPARDFLDSRLKLQDGKLITPPFNKIPGAIGMIPYEPVPADYDIELRLERLSHRGPGFNMGLLVGGRQVAVGMDSGSFSEKVWGLDFLDGRPGQHRLNPTRNPGSRLPVGKTCEVTIQVRNNHITASCDGETLIDWTGAPERLSLWKGVKLPKSDALFFWAQADFVVHKMTLIPRGAVARAKDSNGASPWPADAPPLAISPFDAEQAKVHQEAWAKYLGVPVEKEILLGQAKDGKDIRLSLVLIPPGEFLMGSSEEQIAKLRAQARENGLRQQDFMWIDHEGPQRRVRITRPFYMSRTEFTKAQFGNFIEAAEYSTDAEASGAGSWTLRGGKMVLDPQINWRTQPQTAPGAPVMHVTWNDANACCKWLSGRDVSLTFSLPTEAQWEYACRAGTTTAWSCGDDESVLKEYAIVNSGWYLVGNRKPNPFGLYDMHGNVWEWCRDSISSYRDAAKADPVGPDGEKRIIRGGNCFGVDKTSWHNGNGCRSAVRYEASADHRVVDKGFRVMAAISEEVFQAKLGNPQETPNKAQAAELQWPADAPPPAIAPFDAAQAKAHQEAWAKYVGVPEENEIVLGRDQRGLDIKLTMMLVPPGEFLMGSSDAEIKTLREQAIARGVNRRDLDWIELEGPQRRVRITRPFYLSKHEFTTEQFRAFVDATRYRTEPETDGRGAWPPVGERNPDFHWQRVTRQGPQGPDSPVVNVTWNDANRCCEWLSHQAAGLTFALPTEAQWEYACRAGTTTLWSTGDEESSLENHAVINSRWTRDVGGRLPNAFGLCDMHGDVWELCQEAEYNYRDAGTVDPLGAVDGKRRIIRGGSCFGAVESKDGWMEKSGCRSAVRYHRLPDNPLLQIGFRVAAAISGLGAGSTHDAGRAP